jgi:hypothetical protein
MIAGVDVHARIAITKPFATLTRVCFLHVSLPKFTTAARLPLLRAFATKW